LEEDDHAAPDFLHVFHKMTRNIDRYNIIHVLQINCEDGTGNPGVPGENPIFRSKNSFSEKFEKMLKNPTLCGTFLKILVFIKGESQPQHRAKIFQTACAGWFVDNNVDFLKNLVFLLNF